MSPYAESHAIFKKKKAALKVFLVNYSATTTMPNLSLTSTKHVEILTFLFCNNSITVQHPAVQK